MHNNKRVRFAAEYVSASDPERIHASCACSDRVIHFLAEALSRMSTTSVFRERQEPLEVFHTTWDDVDTNHRGGQQNRCNCAK